MPVREEELPSTIARSPDKVRRTYEEALDNAHRQYAGDEERAHRTAWAAVKHIAEKKGDHWEPKKRPGPSDPQAAKGGEEARRRPSQTFGGVNAGKPKAELYEEAKRAGVEGRSKMTKEELARALQRKYERQTAKARGR